MRRILPTLALALGVLAAFPVRAQLPDAPGTSPARDGGAGHPEAGIPGRVKSQPGEDAGPRDTVDVMKRARERAEGTPVPEPTPNGR
jgi:hypothetical protein